MYHKAHMTQLKPFIAHARKKGMDHQTIRMLLLSSGWKERDIAEAMTEETLDMAVPMPPDAGGARDAFFHLLSFVALYTTVISVIVLFFNYINIWFPDITADYYVSDTSWTHSTIRWAMAGVIVAYPLYLWMNRILLNEMQKHAEKAASGIRRWLTYLTLFVTAAALMADFITLVFYLLDGEISVRFILKVIVVLVLAGMSFLYYFFSLRMDPKAAKQKGLNRDYCIGASIIVIVAIALGIYIAGTPGSSRQQRFDDKRVQDLRTIHSEVQNIIYAGKPIEGVPVKPLPNTLQEVANEAVYQQVVMTDPETSALYVYRVLDATRYQLCATFSLERSQTYDVFWNHPAGEHCYTIDATNVNLR